MGWLDSVRSLFSRKALTQHSQDAPVQGGYHWPATGSFPVQVVGESFHRDSIQRIAGNAHGAKALVFCTAALMEEHDNEHDPNAVSVIIEGAKVGYLSRDQALRFRSVLAHLDLKHPTTCNAVISGGRTDAERQRDFCIELDLDLESVRLAPSNAAPTHHKPTRLDPEPIVLTHTAEECLVKIPFVDAEVVCHCRPGDSIESWERPDGEANFLFTRGSVGGSGRIGVLEKTRFPDLWKDWGNFQHFSVYKIDGRSVVVRAATTIDPRFTFRHEAQARVAILSMGSRPDTADRLAVTRFIVEPRSGKQVADPESLEITLPPGAAGLASLRSVLTSVDALIAHDAATYRQVLKQYVGEELIEKPWGCTMAVFADALPSPTPTTTGTSEAAASPIPSDPTLHCRWLAAALFSHTGKTKRSKTHMSYMLANHVF